MTVDLFSILPELQVTREEVTRAETFVQQYLQSLYPNLDLREGVGLRDLLVRPNATLIALLQKAIPYIFENNTLSGVTDNTSEEIVDGILSNLFLTRRTGTLAKISARLYFAVKKPVVVPSSIAMSPDNVLRFFPVQNYSFSADQVAFDPASGEYYVDIIMRSESEGAKYNVESGSLLYFTNFDAYFLRGEISYLVEGSIPRETNTEFLSRAPSSISTRNLINSPSIESNLKSTFNYLDDIKTVGYGHPEMVRDKKEIVAPGGNAYLTHLGGKVDVYCISDYETLYNQFTLDDTGKVVLSGAYFSAIRSQYPFGQEADEVPLDAPFTVSPAGFENGSLIDWEDDVGFSNRHSLLVDFGASHAGKKVSIISRKFSNLDSIQSYLDDVVSRVVCGDLLARAFDCYILDVKLHSYAKATPEKEVVQASVEKYLRNLKAGEPFIMGNFLDAVYESGITSLKTPVEISYTLVRRNFVNTVGTIIDVETPENETSKFILGSFVMENE